MKKIMSLLLSIFALFALLAITACGSQPADTLESSGTIKASVLDYDTAKVASSEEYRNLQSFEIIPQDVALFIQSEPGAKLIDVREPTEYAESHIENATNIPLSQLSAASLEQNNIKTTDYAVLYCQSGNKSAQAYSIMQNLGYYNSNSIAGGLTRWVEVGLPVVTSPR
ncbi:MAG: rhodanese-like domain-containing protein [Candidatus Gracilibacteria bacterium]